MAFNNSVNARQQGTQYLSSAGAWTGIDASTATFVLTSNGTGVAPSFQAAGGGGTYYSLTPYIVGSDVHSQFTTIQAAITQAIADGASDSVHKVIYVKSGTYAENLNVGSAGGIEIIGQQVMSLGDSYASPSLGGGGGVNWNGTFTMGGGSFSMENILNIYSGSGDIFTFSGTNGVISLKNVQKSPNAGNNIFHLNVSSSLFLVTEGCYLIADNIMIQQAAMGGQVYWSLANCTVGAYPSSDGTLTITKFLQLDIKDSIFGSKVLATSTCDTLAINAINVNYVGIYGPTTTLIDSTASTVSAQFTALGCNLVSTSTMFLGREFGTLLLKNCSVGSIYAASIIDDTSGTGSGVYYLYNCTVQTNNTAIAILDANSAMYLYQCSASGCGLATLGSGASVNYFDTISGGTPGGIGINTVVNSSVVTVADTDGFLHVPSCAGTPVGTPTLYDTAIPMVYDSTNNIPYYYANAAWQSASSSVPVSFSAVLGSDDTLVTGAGATYALGSVTPLTIISDSGGNFNANGTFTAPVTKPYQLTATFLASSVPGTSSSMQIQIITTNRSYVIQTPGTLVANGSGNASLSYTVLADMTAGDTATCNVLIIGGAADTANIYGSTSLVGTSFSGFSV